MYSGMRNRGAIVALLLAQSAQAVDINEDPYGIGDAEDFDPELEALIIGDGEDDDHLGGPGDRLLKNITKLHSKIDGFKASLQYAQGGKRRRIEKKLDRAQDALQDKQQKLGEKLAKWVGKNRMSEEQAASMAAEARIPWRRIKAAPVDPTSPWAMTRPDAAPTFNTATPAPSAPVKQILPNGSVAVGQPSNASDASNGPFTYVNQVDSVHRAGEEVTIPLYEGSNRHASATFGIGAGTRSSNVKLQSKPISYANFELIGYEVQVFVNGRAADTALAFEVTELELEGGKDLLYGPRGVDTDTTKLQKFGGLRDNPRLNRQQVIVLDGTFQQFVDNAAALGATIKASAICRVISDNG